MNEASRFWACNNTFRIYFISSFADEIRIKLKPQKSWRASRSVLKFLLELRINRDEHNFFLNFINWKEYTLGPYTQALFLKIVLIKKQALPTTLYEFLTLQLLRKDYLEKRHLLISMRHQLCLFSSRQI